MVKINRDGYDTAGRILLQDGDMVEVVSFVGGG